MENTANKKKTTIKLTEKKLVGMIDQIVAEAVALKKTEWLNEQKTTKESLLENKIVELEKKFAKLTEGKK